MWIIGLLLLAAAIVAGIEIGISNNRQVDIEAFSHVWTSNPAVAFLVGVITGVVGLFGFWLFFVGIRHSRVRSRARRADIAERDRLAEERRREIEAMDAERGDRDERPVAADRDERPVAADLGDRGRDRERVPATDGESTDLRDDVEDEHDERRGVLHRSHR